MVLEKLFHEESKKLKFTQVKEEEALAAMREEQEAVCFQCGKPRYYKVNCREKRWTGGDRGRRYGRDNQRREKSKREVHLAEEEQQEGMGLVVGHALTSGADP